MCGQYLNLLTLSTKMVSVQTHHQSDLVSLSDTLPVTVNHLHRSQGGIAITYHSVAHNLRRCNDIRSNVGDS